MNDNTLGKNIPQQGSRHDQLADVLLQENKGSAEKARADLEEIKEQIGLLNYLGVLHWINVRGDESRAT